MKKISVGIITFVALFILSGCGSATSGSDEGKPTIKIGYLPITHAVPLYMQVDMINESDADFEVELVKFQSWVDLMDALNTGNIDGASALVTVAMKSKEQGIDLKAVALGHRDGNVLVAGNEIETVEDLRGENFAIPHTFSTHNVLLYEMLTREGMEYTDVTPIEMAPAEMPAALASGQIAGYVVAEPFGAQSVAIDNGHVLYQSEELWQDSIDCALVLREDFIEENKELTQKFVVSYVQAGEAAEEKDSHVHEVTNEFLDVDEEVLDLSLEWISYDDLKIDQDAYSKLTEYLMEMELMEAPPAYEEFVDNSFLEEAM
jgi:NitT/TauT family transport system substrate-binding protein